MSEYDKVKGLDLDGFAKWLAHRMSCGCCPEFEVCNCGDWDSDEDFMQCAWRLKEWLERDECAASGR